MNDFLAPSSEIYSDSLLVRMLRRVGAEGRQTDVVTGEVGRVDRAGRSGWCSVRSSTALLLSYGLRLQAETVRHRGLLDTTRHQVRSDLTTITTATATFRHCLREPSNSLNESFN